ncbi:hypothetical protein [Pedobacter aquatilis]|uniref:hypothetical protein n=1 Tax=Pedobacter aquatilis TaxID=351343 RepID=UPI00292D48BC|nr:hypothetical protein [Pedobacter aquatilis]
MPEEIEEGTSLVRTYVLNRSAEDVKLSLIIGGIEQTGLSLITLDDVSIYKAYPGNLMHEVIGQNNNLGGKKLRVITAVTDTSPNHNDTDLMVLLEGGFVTNGYKLEKTTERDGETVIYTVIISFYQF